MKIIYTFFLVIVFGTTYSQTTWLIDASHSTVEFEVSHLTVSSVTGFFTTFNGTVNSPNNNDFEGAEVSANVAVGSVTTNNLERDKHLKEDDFFNATKYPMITFKSKSFKKIDDESYELTGDLTIRDVTRTIDLDVDFGGIVSIGGKKRAGLTATGKINRFDYGLKWDDSLDNGGLIVGEKVDIILKIEVIKQ